MIIGGRGAPLFLFVGDVGVFAFSLWLTLFLRYGGEPSPVPFAGYGPPFVFLFALWLLVFYMAGLYDKNVILFKSSLPDTLLRTQGLNIALAALFFFFVPQVGIAPKTILLIYLVVSLALVFLWRLVLYPKLSGPRARVRAALFASGEEADELAGEVNENSRYHLHFSYVRPPEELPPVALLEREIKEKAITVLVVDSEHPRAKELMPLVYGLAYFRERLQFAEFADVYEEVFDRVPLSSLEHEWFLKHVPLAHSLLYLFPKRLMDIIGGLVIGAVTVLLIPFVWVAGRLEGPGPLFITQERFGESGSHMKTYKFRSMEKNLASSGEWVHEGQNRITKVGRFLRYLSLDEFPQFINVLAGDLSLVGPRNDTVGLGERLAEALPYYNARYLVKPGITGWAQINQQYEQNHISPQSIEETKTRLAYDFYYLKHRSLGLDIVIALKTLKMLIGRLARW